jgi:hypothetical protein
MVAFLESLSCCSGRTGRCGDDADEKRCDDSGAELRGLRSRVLATPPVMAASSAAEEADAADLRATVDIAEQLLPGGVMTPWQRRFCDCQTVRRYLHGRNGDPAAAAEIFAQALRWREEYQEVLSGAREPKWQTDLRVLARGEAGYPIIYGCFRFNVPATRATTQHIIEHMAAVMEAAALAARRRGASGADTIMDCHGYRMADNMNPAPLLALMRMANQPYRDGLRTAIVVDAPASFQVLWRAAKPLLSEKTKRKIRFLSREEAVKLLVTLNGPRAAQAVDRVMRLNRGAEGCPGSRFPSELSDDEAEEVDSREGPLPLLSRALSGPRMVRQQGRKASALRLLTQLLLPSFMCCRRRAPIADVSA